MTEKGLVLYGNGVDYTVIVDDKEIIARLRGKLLHTTKRSHHPVCSGDYVKLIKEKDDYQISEILPRKNKISRPSNYQIRKEQVIAANIDYLFLIVSVYSPRFNTGFIDRILTYSNMQQIETIIVVNKVDLGVSDYELECIEGYKKIGYKVIGTSTKENTNIDKIEELTSGNITAFIGNSGVGKSSILNSIDPTVMQKVNETSTYSLKGKHTTKQSRLFPIRNGGYIMDTPGIREFGLWNIEWDELKNYFPEIHALSSKCKFHNCLHKNEPGCAVRNAAENESIPDFRYENYLRILDTLYENRNIYFKKDE
ncbi:MAG: ribosome small subunit-dependent GTPase A [Candidatus Delongbacteria bacterium]|nr:ribosome small subunit-dependent GTPase A [Candidatus Delongbacteria bacterium]